jgi:hypothetical protein
MEGIPIGIVLIKKTRDGWLQRAPQDVVGFCRSFGNHPGSGQGGFSIDFLAVVLAKTVLRAYLEPLGSP